MYIIILLQILYRLKKKKTTGVAAPGLSTRTPTKHISCFASSSHPLTAVVELIFFHDHVFSGGPCTDPSIVVVVATVAVVCAKHDFTVVTAIAVRAVRSRKRPFVAETFARHQHRTLLRPNNKELIILIPLLLQ